MVLVIPRYGPVRPALFVDAVRRLGALPVSPKLQPKPLANLGLSSQITGYEAVHEVVYDAVSKGVIAPSISPGFYLQCEIWDVLKWRNTKLQR